MSFIILVYHVIYLVIGYFLPSLSMSMTHGCLYEVGSSYLLYNKPILFGELI